MSRSVHALAAALVGIAVVGQSAAVPCVPGELNGDRVVDGADLGILLAAWGSTGHAADLDGDGIVDGADLAVLLANWGVECPQHPWFGGSVGEAVGFAQSSPVPWATILEQSPDPAVVTSAALRSAIVATGLPWRIRDNASRIEMLLVPPGTFMMGCTHSLQFECFGNEWPVHQVTLTKAFYLGRYEVTQSQWTAMMGSNPSWFQGASAAVPSSQVPNRPVERVSWNMISAFNAATGLRLPTSAEWEYACRAGTVTAFHSIPGFPNGTNNDGLLGTMAWMNANSSAQTRPVGQKPANALGFHDMLGNAWEWVGDRFGQYPFVAVVDPPGPPFGASRVMRGGGWDSPPDLCRVSARAGVSPSNNGNNFGFRAARSP